MRQHYKSKFLGEAFNTLKEFGSFEEYKKEVCDKIKSIFDKLEEEKSVDSGLLGRDMPRRAYSHTSLSRLIQDIITKYYNNLNIIIRNNVNNVWKVVYKKMNDDVYWTYIQVPNLSLSKHDGDMKDIRKNVETLCKDAGLQEYDTQDEPKVTWHYRTDINESNKRVIYKNKFNELTDFTDHHELLPAPPSERGEDFSPDNVEDYAKFLDSRGLSHEDICEALVKHTHCTYEEAENLLNRLGI